MGPKKAFFLIVAIVGLTLIGGSTVYYFADQYLSQKAKEISILKADLEIVELKIANARQATNDFERFGFIKEVTDTVLPPEKIQSDLVGELITFADRSGVRLDTISFQPTDQNATVPISQTEPLPGVPGVNTLPVNMVVSGNYNNLLGFLDRVETNRRKMQVETMSISPDSDTGNISTSLEINVYVRARS